jgi:hypothetical protein
MTSGDTGSTATDGFSIIVEDNTNDVLLNQRENATIRTYVNGSERMRIDASGNVGIGTSSPSYKLEVSDAVKFDGQIRASTGSAAAPAYTFHADNTLGMFRNPNVLGFAVAGTERMRIDGSGNVLVGTTTFNNIGTESNMLVGNNVVMARGGLAGHQDACAVLQYSSDATWLRAYGDTAGSGYMVFRTGGGAGTTDTEAMRIQSDGLIDIGAQSGSGVGRVNISANPSNNYQIEFWNTASVSVGSITVSGGGTATAYNTSSDYRLKENVVYDWTALDRLNQLKPARFNFIASADTTVDGFLAHEVQDIVPEAIHGTKDEVNEEGNPVYQGIDHSKLVPLLTKAIQEQQVLIEQLQAEVALLKGE